MGNPSKESFYKRLRELSDVKSAVKETNQGAQGTLIDFNRSNDGTAYGVVKESHHYFIKKSTSQGEKLNETDFVYIGGLQNKNEYRYESLGEAEKQRNFYVQSLNEAFSLQPKKSADQTNKSTIPEKIENPYKYIKGRISENKKANKENLENKFKSTLKENTEQIKKRTGLMPETAEHAIKKALGKLNEEEILATADSKIKDVDRLDNKTNFEKGQSTALNQDDNQKKADKAQAKDSVPAKPKTKGSIAVNASDKPLKEGESLIVADSQIIAGDSPANEINQKHEPAQAPINDENAKKEADKHDAKGKGSTVDNKPKEESETEDVVAEGKAMSTEDSLQKDADVIANSKKVTEKPKAPYNSYNQPDKGQKEKKGTPLKTEPSRKDVVAEPLKKDVVAEADEFWKKSTDQKEKDIITADSKEKQTDAVANKTKTDLPKKHGKSEIVADSKEKPKDSVVNKTKTNLPNPVFEAEKKIKEGEDLITADSQENPEDSVANKTEVDLPNPIYEDDKVNKELDNASKALDDLNVADVGSEQQPSPDAVVAPEAGVEGGNPEDNMPPLGADTGEEPDATATPETGVETGKESGDTEDLLTKEIQKLVGKLGEKVRNADLTPDQTKSFMNSIIAAFKSDLGEVDVEDRKEMSDKVLKAQASSIEGGENEPEAGIEGGEEQPSPEGGLEGGEEQPATSISPEGGAPTPAGAENANPEANDAIDQQINKLQTSEKGKKVGENKNAIDDETSECSECGTFENYAKSRGYNRLNEGEGSGMEIANLISGFANAYKDGKNDGDFKAVAVFLSPNVEKELNDYGHEDYVEKVKPFAKELTDDQKVDFGNFEPQPPAETDIEPEDEEPKEIEPEVNEPESEESVPEKENTEESKEKKNKKITEGEEINELGWRDIKNFGGALAGTTKQYGNQAQQGVMNKVQQGVGKVKQFGQDVAQNVKQFGQGVSQTWNKNLANSMVADIQTDAAKLGDTIAKFNEKATKAGQKPIPIQSIMMQILNQIKRGGGINLSNRRFESEKIGEDTVFAKPPQTLAAGTIKNNVTEGEELIRNYVKLKLEEKIGKRKPSLNEGEKSKTIKVLDKLIDEQWNLYKNEMKKVDEKWGKDVKIKSTGEHAGKTIEQINKELEALKKRSEKYQEKGEKVPEEIKEKEAELNFAKRSKQNWK